MWCVGQITKRSKQLVLQVRSLPLSKKAQIKICLPTDTIERKFIRSGGPGGQNVNKVNTKCEIRFNLFNALWIPNEIREIFSKKYSRYVGKDGDVFIQSDKTRHQHENFQNCIEKLQTMLETCKVEYEDSSRQPTEEDVKILEQRQVIVL